MSKAIDLCGLTFGRLSVIEESDPVITPSGQKNWIMKLVMPVLKKQNVDMKIASKVLDNLLKKNDAIHGKDGG